MIIVPRVSALALFAILALSACARHESGTTPTASAVTLHLVSQGDPHSLNPLLARSFIDAQFAALSFDSLVEADATNRLVPVLATTVPTLANGGIARDGLTYTIHLRHGVRWQDGHLFSSADVAYTVRTILDPRVNVADRNGFSEIARVVTPDADTVIFHLKHRFAPFIEQVCERYPIVPQHLLAKSKDLAVDPFNGAPIGTGPYRLVRWDRGSSLSYTANRAYFRGAPRIERVTVAVMPDIATQGLALRRHDIDFAGVDSAGYAMLRSDSSLHRAIEPYNDFVSIALNTQRNTLADLRVRRAIAMAIDRPRITHDNTFGTGSTAYADLPGFLWTARVPRSPTPFDPKAAAALLDAAGWHARRDGMRERGGRPLHLDGIAFAGSATGRNVYIQTQQMLRAVGIDVAFKYFAPGLYFAPAAAGGPLALGRFDIASFALSAGSDPRNDEIYTCANRAPNGQNFARYCSARMDTLQTTSLRELEPAARLRIVAEIEQLAAADVPYVFLYYTPKRLFWTPALHRTRSNLTTLWYDVRSWTLEREVSENYDARRAMNATVASS